MVSGESYWTSLISKLTLPSVSHFYFGVAMLFFQPFWINRPTVFGTSHTAGTPIHGTNNDEREFKLKFRHQWGKVWLWPLPKFGEVVSVMSFPAVWGVILAVLKLHSYELVRFFFWFLLFSWLTFYLHMGGNRTTQMVFKKTYDSPNRAECGEQVISWLSWYFKLSIHKSVTGRVIVLDATPAQRRQKLGITILPLVAVVAIKRLSTSVRTPPDTTRWEPPPKESRPPPLMKTSDRRQRYSITSIWKYHVALYCM